MPKRKSKRLSRKIGTRKPKAIVKGGFSIDPTLSKVDLKDAPSILRGFTAGDDSVKLEKIQTRRDKLFAQISGKGGIKVKFKRPGFAKKSSRLSGRYNPKNAGRLREHYQFFIEYEYSIVDTFNQDNPKTESEAKRIGQVDKYEALRRYFGKAEIGARTAYTPRPPTSASRFAGDFSIRQTLGSFRKKGIDKKKLRDAIAATEERLKGFAVVTGVRGVWRSPRSEEFAFKQTAIRQRKAKDFADKGGLKLKKPKRSRRI